MKKKKDVYISFCETSSLYVNCNNNTIRKAKKQTSVRLLLAITAVTMYKTSMQRFMHYFLGVVPVLPRVPFLAPAIILSSLS